MWTDRGWSSVTSIRSQLPATSRPAFSTPSYRPCRASIKLRAASVPAFFVALVDATDGVSSFTCLMDEMSDAFRVGGQQPGGR